MPAASPRVVHPCSWGICVELAGMEEMKTEVLIQYSNNFGLLISRLSLFTFSLVHSWGHQAMDPASPTFSCFFYLDIIAMNQTDINACFSLFSFFLVWITGVRETCERNCDGDMFCDCHHCLLWLPPVDLNLCCISSIVRNVVPCQFEVVSMLACCNTDFENQ